MSKVYYPAVYHVAEDVGGYWVEFPDLPGCFSQGKDEIEAMEMAKDSLSLWLDQSGDIVDREISKPSHISDIKEKNPDEIVMLIEGDPDYYSRKYNTKAVKKTLSIPQWLNDKAVESGINFSQVLKEALINKLGL